MKTNLSMIKSVGVTRHFLVGNVPWAGSFSAELLPRLADILVGAGTSILSFDLPADAVAPIPDEISLTKPKTRLAPLTLCRHLFPRVWEKAAGFGVCLDVFVFGAPMVAKSALDSATMLVLKIGAIEPLDAVDTCARVMQATGQPKMVMSQFWDGHSVLLSVSPEKIESARAILLLFDINVKGDELDFGP